MPFTVTQDRIALAVTFTLPERIAASDIPVQWSAVETGSGLRGYDVEWRMADGDWTPWLTATAQTQATFAGALGVAYTFPSAGSGQAASARRTG